MYCAELTAMIASDSSLHQTLHPLAYNDRIIRAEIMRFLMLVQDLESVLARVRILVRNDFVSLHAYVSFDLLGL